jgi:hypothetical protein
MEPKAIPRDDLLDVLEMTQKLEAYMSHILKDNETSLSMSALMSATLNQIFMQCTSLEEVIMYRDIFMQLFDRTIRLIKTREN